MRSIGAPSEAVCVSRRRIPYFPKFNVPDRGRKHEKQGITAFDTQKVNFYDGSRAYTIKLSVGILKSGEKIAYAKKFSGYNAELTKKIQAAETRGLTNTPANQQPVLNSIIAGDGKKVNDESMNFSISDSDGSP